MKEPQQKIISVPKKVKQEIKKKDIMNRLSKTPVDSGCIYVSHLPQGFVEEGMFQYFEQFGKVLRVKLARSKKNARSKGYGWVLFQFKEVAITAAKTINGYIMYGKQVQSRYLDPNDTEQRNPFLMKGVRKYKFIDWQSKFIQKRNKNKTDEQVKAHLQTLLKNEEEKRQKLKEMGINYSFSGFKALLNKKTK